MTILYWLDRVSSSDRPLVGEKAFVLSQLQRRGLPIVRGFTIVNTAFQEFFEHLDDSGSILADFPHASLYLDVNDANALQVVARESRRAIRRSALPPRWIAELTEAVGELDTDALIWRFSLPATLARRSDGLLVSPVSRTSPEAIEAALKTAWAELFTARSLFYWRRMGIGLETVRLALLVQPLIRASCSGNTIVEPDRLRIEATWGLGQSLSAGEVAPDLYTIDRATRAVIDRRVGNKPRCYYVTSDDNPLADSGAPSVFAESAPPVIVPRLLNHEEQTGYCLDDDALDRLAGLGRALALEKPTLRDWQWSIDDDSRLYLLDCHDGETVSSPLVYPRFPLKGQPASPGIVSGLARVLVDPDLGHEDLAGSILVTSNLPPRRLPYLKSLRGLITEHGGLASHGAILARELGIPAVVGVAGVTRALKSGDIILLDGTTGTVSKGEKAIELPVTVLDSPLDPVVARTKLMVNISQIESLPRALNLPADGIGLLRSEWAIGELLARRPLAEWLADHRRELLDEIVNTVGSFAGAFAPRPVFYRAFDGGIDELGNDRRGTLAYTLDSTFFDLELQALRRLQLMTATDIHLVLPFVRDVSEFRWCRERVIDAGLTRIPSFRLWIMAEVPSVIFQLADYVRAGVQGIAIGTNDLSRALLGIDRERPPLSEYLNSEHPALRAALGQLVQQARQLGIPCSVCGMAIVENPDLIEDLVRWGVTTLSVDPGAVITTREAIVRAEKRLVMEKARPGSIE